MTPHIEARLLAAYQKQQSGHVDNALEDYRSILKDDPSNHHAHNLAGVVLLNLGELRSALDHLDQAATIEPNDPQTQSNLGLALQGTGDFVGAAKAFETALALSPGNPVGLKNLGASYLQLDRIEEARRCFLHALRLLPREPEVLTNLARAELQLGRSELALDLARQALHLKPELAEAELVAGNALLRQCAYEEAVATFDRALAINPGLLDAAVDRATALKEQGQTDIARNALTDLCQSNTNSARAHYALGLLDEQSGEIDSAASSYRKAIENNRHYGAAWFQLAQLPSQIIELKAQEELDAAYRNQRGASEHAHLCFAKARIEDAAARHDSALDLYTEGHDSIMAGAAYSPARAEKLVDGIIQHAGGPNLPGHANEMGGDVTVPILVVGMPRSGTTLAEQILATNSQVGAGGESSFLEDVVREASRAIGDEYPWDTRRIPQALQYELANEYRRRLASLGTGEAFIIDKTPLNFQYLGLVRQILPDARIIHCHRDPIETCVSIYRLPFDRSQTYAHSLGSLGHYYSQYARLMKHWQRTLPGVIFDLSLEGLIAEPQRAIQGLANHCGLEFEPAMLRYHEQQRTVRTPSTAQVRKPLARPEKSWASRYGVALAQLHSALDGADF